jgi:hypothetical protein
MEWLETAGTLVAVFFLISLAVETILENFRGLLALFGIEWLKSKQTLQEGLDEVAEFLPSDQKDLARFEALVSKVEAASANVGDIVSRITRIRGDLAKAIDPVGKLAIIDREKEWLAAASAPLKMVLDRREANRVYVLRFISAVIGIGVASATQIDVLGIIGNAKGEPTMLGYVLAGLAAAGGSSFWHDQLDRIRSLKEAGESVASLTATVRKPA